MVCQVKQPSLKWNLQIHRGIQSMAPLTVSEIVSVVLFFCGYICQASVRNIKSVEFLYMVLWYLDYLHNELWYVLPCLLGEPDVFVYSTLGV